MTSALPLFKATLDFTVINNDAMIEARKTFEKYQEEGVITPDADFNSSVWHTTDEYSNVGLHFKINREGYSRYEKILDMDHDTFVMSLKTYVLSLFGRNALLTIQGILYDIKKILNTRPSQIIAGKTDLVLKAPRLCAGLFLAISEDNDAVDKIVDAMDSYADKNLMQNSRQRTLAELDTYFRFDDILNEYWGSDLSERDRMFFYPLYLWWKLTAVLPLRPREFLLTRRNCISRSEGRYYLMIRRNKLKGGGRNIAYKLDSDYVDERYHIPDSLGKEIEEYIARTDGFAPTDIDTLFIPDPHYHKWSHRRPRVSRYLTYTNMNTILHYFYEEVISGIYGFQILYDNPERHLADNEIQYIRLGDTRHIALINIMQEGGTPVTAMLLAGHDGTDMASHYYSNVTSLIECRTYRQYRKMITGDIQYRLSGSSFFPSLRKVDGIRLEDGGMCLSESFADGDICDCTRAVGDNGEIGYCPACKHYRNYQDHNFVEDNIYKGQLYSDCKMLADTIALIRRDKGCAEDVGEILLRLNASSRAYEDFLLHKSIEEGKCHE